MVDKYTWVDVGSNYLLSEIQAALLLAELHHRQTVQQKRAAVWHRYDTALPEWAGANDVRLPIVPADCSHPSHLYYLLLPTPSARTRLIEHLKQHGILAVFHYIPLHTSPMGRRAGGAEGDCPVAEDVSARLLRLPFFTDLSTDDQDTVVDAVRRFRV
jgi:dTDP-4-amino-4,6-dideoxygalactose transaminase